MAVLMEQSPPLPLWLESREQGLIEELLSHWVLRIFWLTDFPWRRATIRAYAPTAAASVHLRYESTL